MAADVSTFCEILLHILKEENSGDSEKKGAERFFLKDKFTLNYLNRPRLNQKGRPTKTLVKGLSEIIDAESLGERLIIASANVTKAQEEQEDEDADSLSSEEQDGEASFGENHQQFSNEVKISMQETVHAGAPGSAMVYFLNSKTHLQSTAGGVAMEDVLNTDDLAPLKFNDARYLLSVYIQAINYFKKKEGQKYAESIKLPWLLIKCDKKPPQAVSWLYSTIFVDENKHGFFRTFLMKDSDSVLDYEMECQRLCGNRKASVSYMSKYDFLGSILSNSDSEKDTSSLFIEFAWQEQSLPFQPVPLSADAVAKLKIVPSDSCSSLAPVYIELMRLMSITDPGDGANSFWESSPEVLDENSNIICEIPVFLEELMNVNSKEEKSTKKEESNDELSTPLLSYVLSGFKRNDMDFTDKLWDFMKCTKSMEEMIYCLDKIFPHICTRELQPVFSSDNVTQFAKMVRKFYKTSDLAVASDQLREEFDDILDNPDRILEMMADMGLAKFEKDYTSFFVNEELATFGQLEPVISKANGIKERMSAILKLHYCLELVSYGKAYLKLEMDHLRILLRACLEYLENNQVSAPYPTFSLSIPSVSASALNNLCQGIKPEAWKMTSLENQRGKENMSMLIFYDNTNQHQRECDEDSIIQENTSPEKHYRAVSVTESNVRIF